LTSGRPDGHGARAGCRVSRDPPRIGVDQDAS
jgi:hypothetical protein